MGGLFGHWTEVRFSGPGWGPSQFGESPASLPLTISWCIPPPARGNRPQTGIWRPACPRAASASTLRSWPRRLRRLLLRPGLPLVRDRWPGPGPHGLQGSYPRRPPRPCGGVRGAGSGAALFRRGRRRGLPVIWPPRRGRLGARRVAGAAERRARRFLEPHPRRKAGGPGRRRGRGGSAGAGRPGFRGLRGRESGVEGDV